MAPWHMFHPPTLHVIDCTLEGCVDGQGAEDRHEISPCLVTA